MDGAELDRDLLDRCLAALTACADDSVVCGITAARVHEMWLPALPDDIHVAAAEPGVAGREMIRSRRGDVQAHRRQLPIADVRLVGGVRVTSPAATWFDLAPQLSLPALVTAGDSILRQGTRQDELDDVIVRRRAHRGVRLARHAAGLLDPRSRSRPESHMRVATVAPDLPRFEVNVSVSRCMGGWLAEPDLSLEAAKIALEYQGADHAKLPRMRRDLTRAFDMREDGWIVLPYGPAEVFGRPWQILAEVRALIRARRPDLLVGRRIRPRHPHQPRHPGWAA